MYALLVMNSHHNRIRDAYHMGRNKNTDFSLVGQWGSVHIPYLQRNYECVSRLFWEVMGKSFFIVEKMLDGLNIFFISPIGEI